MEPPFDEPVPRDGDQQHRVGDDRIHHERVVHRPEVAKAQPPGAALVAGKVTKKAEEDRKAAELAKLAEDVAAAKAEIKTIGGVPVPEENPGIASLQDDSGRMPFWQRWLKEKTPQQAAVPTEDAAVEGAVTAPADSRPEAEAEQQATTARTAQAADNAAATEPGQDAAATVQTPAADEKPFWKFWEK